MAGLVESHVVLVGGTKLLQSGTGISSSVLTSMILIPLALPSEREILCACKCSIIRLMNHNALPSDTSLIPRIKTHILISVRTRPRRRFKISMFPTTITNLNQHLSRTKRLLYMIPGCWDHKRRHRRCRGRSGLQLQNSHRSRGSDSYGLLSDGKTGKGTVVGVGASGSL